MFIKIREFRRHLKFVNIRDLQTPLLHRRRHRSLFLFLGRVALVRGVAAYSHQTFRGRSVASVGASACPVHCGKTSDQIRMPFGIIGRTGPGMRQVVGFGDQSVHGNGYFWGRIWDAPLLLMGTYFRSDAAIFPNYLFLLLVILRWKMNVLIPFIVDLVLYRHLFCLPILTRR